MNQDQQHLELLSIFHYIVGGLTALFACFPIFHLIIGIVFIIASKSSDANGDVPPAFVGWILVIVASFFMLIGWSLAVCVVIAGRNLAKCTRRTFCLVIAGIECIMMPFGTVLGVFTIIVLMRENVIQLFATQKASQLSISNN